MVRAAALAVLVVVNLSGCTSRISGRPVSNRIDDDRALITGYFAAVNAAARDGSAAQERLFARTQHPDFRSSRCSLHGLTLTADPAYSTLRIDPHWHPAVSGQPPRGTVYVVAVDLTVRNDAATLGNQIGSLHVVVLDDTAYGFTPCPA